MFTSPRRALGHRFATPSGGRSARLRSLLGGGALVEDHQPRRHRGTQARCDRRGACQTAPCNGQKLSANAKGAAANVRGSEPDSSAFNPAWGGLLADANQLRRTACSIPNSDVQCGNTTDLYDKFSAALASWSPFEMKKFADLRVIVFRKDTNLFGPAATIRTRGWPWRRRKGSHQPAAQRKHRCPRTQASR